MHGMRIVQTLLRSLLLNKLNAFLYLFPFITAMKVVITIQQVCFNLLRLKSWKMFLK